MFHVEPVRFNPPPVPHDVVPLFVNLPIRTDADLERALVQDESA